MKISAEELTEGQTFTYGSHTYTVLGTEYSKTEVNVISVFTEENPGLPMDFYLEDPVIEAEVSPSRAAKILAARKIDDLDMYVAEQVADARRELAELRDPSRDRAGHTAYQKVPADHRIEYYAGKKRRIEEYTTRAGFLRAYVRLMESPKHEVLHVD